MRVLRTCLLFTFIGFALLAPFGISRAAPLADPDDTPENVATEVDRYTIYNNKIYMQENQGCAPIRDANGDSIQRQKRVAAPGSPTRNLYSFTYDTFCTTSQPDFFSNTVADANYIYWWSRLRGGIARLPEGSLGSETPTQVVNYPVTGADSFSKLLLVGDNFYLLERDGLFRMNKNTGVVTPLLTGTQTGTNTYLFQSDGLYLYWLNSGDLQRYRLSDGELRFILGDVKSFYPVDGVTVYLGLRNAIRMYDNPTNELSVNIYTTPPNADITSIAAAVGNSNIWFIQTQVCSPACPGANAIYRLPLSGGGATAIFTPPVSPIQSLNELKYSNGYLFYQNNRTLQRLSATALAVPLASMAIAPADLEITQGIQNNVNGIQLIQGRTTYIRVFARALGGNPVSNVTALLYRADVSGNPTGSPLLPVNRFPTSGGFTRFGYINVLPSPNRDNLNDGFLFQLPPDWVTGTSLRVQVQLNPYRYPPESNYADNVATTAPFALVSSRRLQTELVALRYDLPGGGQTAPRYREDVLTTISFIRRTYPLASTPGYSGISTPGFRPGIRYLYDASLDDRVAQTHPDCLGMDVSVRNLCASGYINGVLRDLRGRLGLPGSVFMYGMIPDTIGFPRGQEGGGGASSGPSGPTPGAFPAEADGTYADWYAAHEIGHSLGRPHPSQGNMCGHSASDGSFPYANAAIGNPGIHRGFDVGDTGLNSVLTPQVLSPATWRDFMSYCLPQWISDYTYNALYSAIPTGAEPTPTRPVGGDVITVDGYIVSATNTATLFRTRRIISVPTVQVPGVYSIRLVDSGGIPLATYAFTPTAIEESNGDLLTIAETVPYVPGTRVLQIVQGATVLEAIAISTNFPVVSNVQASATSVTWNASDADGDTLTYDLYYSRDNGASFSMIQMNLPAASATVDTTVLGGSTTAMFRVVANDGFNEGIGDSNVVSIPANPPLIHILEPADGERGQFGQTFTFRAEVFDWQDGTLDNANIEWRDQTNFLIGTGYEFATDNLLIGENIITVTATNNAGASASVTFTIFISDDFDFPTPSLSAAPASVAWHIGAGVTTAQTASVTVNNPADGTATFTIEENLPWLTVTGNTGTPATLTFTGDASALTDGDFLSGTVRLVGTGDTTAIIEIPVTLSKGNVWEGPIVPPPSGNRLFLPLIQRD